MENNQLIDKIDNIIKYGPKYTLIKLSDDIFEGKHPNHINEGYTKSDGYISKLEIGNGFCIGSLKTSKVTEIISQTNDEIIFKTLNSTYKLITNY